MNLHVHSKTMMYLLLYMVSELAGFVAIGGFYNEFKGRVDQGSILKTFPGVKATTCLHKCRRNKECKTGAIRHKDSACLLLGSSYTTGSKIEVDILQEEQMNLEPSKYDQYVSVHLHSFEF